MSNLIFILVYCCLFGATEIEADYPVPSDDYASTYEVDRIILEDCMTEESRVLISDHTKVPSEDKASDCGRKNS